MSAVELRLSAVRELLAQGRYDALIVPRADEYLGEYLPAHNERLRWLTGFTGSAGLALILAQRAAILWMAAIPCRCARKCPRAV